MSYTFRIAHPSDVRRCIFVRARTRENAVSEAELARRGITEASWRGEVEDGRLIGHVCEFDDTVVGYCFADRATGEIVVLAILPNHEFKGIGKTLLSFAEKNLRELGFTRIFLECSTDPNVRSYSFYRHLGWTPTGVYAGHGDEILERVL